MRLPLLVDVYLYIQLLVMGQMLMFHFVQCDLADLLGEARCAAHCFEVFVNSLSETDWHFIEQQPDLTHQYCVKRSPECALCLDVCQWPRGSIQDCEGSCKQSQLGTQHQLSSAIVSTSSLAAQTSKEIATPNNYQRQTICLTTCQFARYLVDQSTTASNPTCPLLESWPPSCQHLCKTDGDCGLRKCCPQVACTNSPETARPAFKGANGNVTSVCTPGVLISDGARSQLPSVPHRPNIQQLKLPSGQSADYEQTEQSKDTAALNQYRLELDWSLYYKDRASPKGSSNRRWYPAVFLVQLRLFNDPSAAFMVQTNPDFGHPIDQNFEELTRDHLFGDWRNLVWTTNLGAMLSDLGPGTWYQFRILAVSSKGHGGWSQPTKQVFVFEPPIPPSSPRNLTEFSKRLYDSHVDVTIRWDAPEHGNLPLKKYEVNWCQYFGFSGSDQCSVTEYHANVPGDKHQYTIQNLKPGTTYKIELKAVSIFEEKELSSYPVKLYISTKEAPPRKATSGSTNPSLSNESCQCGHRQSPMLRIKPPYLDDKQLQAQLVIGKIDLAEFSPSSQFIVEWTPRVCIQSQNVPSTSGVYQSRTKTVQMDELKHFVLTDLIFQCHYRISICRASGDLAGSTCQPLWSDCFCTPTCHSVHTTKGQPQQRNCTDQDAGEPISSVHLNYTILPGGQQQNTITDKKDTVLIINYLSLVEEPGGSTENTFDAIVSWHPVIPSTSSKLEYMKEQWRTKRSWKSEVNINEGDSYRSPSLIRGVRVTWGPRVPEPVPVEFYQNGLSPHLDPEKTQSKVLAPQHSRLLLKGLRQEVVYIVRVQLMGEQSDGPVSSLFFAIPNVSIPKSSTCQHQEISIFIPSVIVGLILLTGY